MELIEMVIIGKPSTDFANYLALIGQSI